MHLEGWPVKIGLSAQPNEGAAAPFGTLESLREAGSEEFLETGPFPKTPQYKRKYPNYAVPQKP
jgi:hypothetical protein